MTNIVRITLEDKLGKLDADIKVHEDTLARLMAERRGILFALDTIDKAASAAPADMVMVIREDAPPKVKRKRRTREEIARDNAVDGGLADAVERINPVTDRYADVPPIPENPKRTG